MYYCIAAVHADASLTQVGERQMSSAAERGGRLCLSVARPALSLALQALNGTPQSEGYAPLYNPFEQFFSRYVYRRVRHCFNRPICSAPGVELTLKERRTGDHNWTFRAVEMNVSYSDIKLASPAWTPSPGCLGPPSARGPPTCRSAPLRRRPCEADFNYKRSFTGTERRCINLGSYNYLGFAEGEGECARASAFAARRYGLVLGSSRAELGTCPLHTQLEAATARFLGVESAIVFGMGFATNTLALPGLLGPGCLAISDEKNHASLILGMRLARVTVRVFRHNDVKHLEKLAREAVAEGKWTKIIVVVEGVYSMEGSVVPLPAVLAIKRRYSLYLYLDEAHSVGAMGPRGRGVTDLYGVDPRDVDVLMGTFTKSFGAAGGYIAEPGPSTNPAISAFNYGRAHAGSPLPRFMTAAPEALA
ncbi:Serine palmitoyltransferase 2 [Eumeta japonica]|uniref:serine C-palmitoyltransferase n=1 Tax=Eumeta variegata TaxID=151549 RepID=A0A4C1WQM5_EUMVA|nr:Serine palmitoyltransferase 2 [Eumeta japonica]